MPRTLVAPPLFLAACLVLSACGGGKSETFRVASGAMLPTLLPGDVVLAAKGPFASAARRGEVVAFRDPEEPQRLYLKRAVALGGDRLRVEAGRLELNGVKVPARLVDAAFRYEDSDVESADRRQRQAELWREELDGWGYLVIHDRDAPPAEAVETVVPPEHVFVLGDNRGNSRDSRHFGPVPLSSIVGRALYVVYSRGPEGFRRERFFAPLDAGAGR